VYRSKQFHGQDPETFGALSLSTEF
jgi:hypothetical protein